MKSLVLSGGGVRGTAHVALLERLDDLGMSFDSVIGTSAGSIVGGVYCLTGDSVLTRKRIFEAVEEFLPEFLGKFRKSWGVTTVLEGFVQRSAVPLEDYYPFFRKLFGRKKFSDCVVDFKAVVFNLQTMESEVLDCGYLVDAVLASSSVPGFFEPSWIAGFPVVDGGVLDNVPVRIARGYGAEYVLASAFEIYHSGMEDPVLEIMGLEDEMRERIMQGAELEEADDVVLHRVEVGWDEFDRYMEVYVISRDFLSSWVPKRAEELGYV